MDPRDRRRLIDQYKDGYRVVTEALGGARGNELHASPAPGEWSVRDVVHHLADSEMISAARLRLLLASDHPTIFGYDQDEFARRLHYDTRSLHASLAAFQAARITTGEILERMSEEDWQREGTHSESGRYTVEQWLEISAAHAHGHAEQIRMAREAARAAG